MLSVGSAFTGVGGADLGLEWAGFNIAWQCELDEWKRSILRSHWLDVPLYDDITTLDDPAPVDLLVGGFPCQDLSVAGKRKGFSGERSILAFEFLRLAESLQPRWLLLENVPGLLSSNRGRDFARLVDEVVACGYGVAWRILNARYFNVPQRRRRVFIVARRADAQFDTRAASGLALRALREGGSGDPTPGWPPGADATADAGRSAQSCGEGCVAFRKSKRAQTDQDDETWVQADETNTLNRFDAGDTRATQLIAETASTLQAQHGRGFACNAEMAAGGQLIPTDVTVRRLTPVECERLMGWPDNWTAPDGIKAPDSKRYAACGDGIVSWVAYWIGQRIRMIDAANAAANADA